MGTGSSGYPVQLAGPFSHAILAEKERQEQRVMEGQETKTGASGQQMMFNNDVATKLETETDHWRHSDMLARLDEGEDDLAGALREAPVGVVESVVETSSGSVLDEPTTSSIFVEGT
ncbi:unnamed protein product [Amoebophrya sp. A25]|nr:unnamed protein product [Amoebophrya sp. A25]|eukprot:GSA25T00024407001.1